MPAEAAAFVRTWTVGEFRATLTAPAPRRGEALSAVIEWTPHVPQRLTPAEVAEYRAGRDEALRDLSQHLGARVALLEV